MNRLLRIAARISRVHLANAYGFEKLPGFGVHFRPEEVDRYESIPEDIRAKLKKALHDHDSLTAKSYELFKLNSSRGNPVSVFNARKNGLLTGTKALLEEIRSRYPNADLSKADKLINKLFAFKLTDELNEKDQHAYDTWMSYHHELLSHLLYVAFDEEARGGNKVASTLVRIAIRIISRDGAFEMDKLPTLDDTHVYEDDIDKDFELVPEEIRNLAKNAIRSHDSIQDWAKDTDFSKDALGDPIKRFVTKRKTTMMDAKWLLEEVEKEYPSLNLTKAKTAYKELKDFQPIYEEDAKSLVDLPSSTTNNWTSYLHNLISNLLFVARESEKEKEKNGEPRAASIMEKMEFDPEWIEGFMRAGENNARWLNEFMNA